MYLYNSATHKKLNFQTHTPGRRNVPPADLLFIILRTSETCAVILWRCPEKALRREG